MNNLFSRMYFIVLMIGGFSLVGGLSEILAATFTVTTAADAGAGSLRQAILDSNATPGSNLINFNISGAGPHTITLVTALPALAVPVEINGYTEQGAQEATATTPAALQIELNGNNIPFNGLDILATAGGSTIKGLVINRFGSDGIKITNSERNTITGNYIGTNVTGTVALPNADGIALENSNRNTIGGLTPAARNVVSGNFTSGISLSLGSVNNTIIGNFIGVDAVGTNELPNNGNGILIGLNVSMNIIGGLESGAANVISGNLGWGILFNNSGAVRNQILGNFIGTDLSRSANLPNQLGGIRIQVGAGPNNNNLIKCNTITNNSSVGVRINGPSVGNAILSNSIFDNSSKGIDLVTGGNNNQPAPVIASATASGQTIRVSGTLASPNRPNSTFRIEFFVNQVDRGAITEGRTFVGARTVTTDGSGDASFNNVRLPSTAKAGQFVSATATLIDGDNPSDTSEFSANQILVNDSSESALSVAIFQKYCNTNDNPCKLPLTPLIPSDSGNGNTNTCNIGSSCNSCGSCR